MTDFIQQLALVFKDVCLPIVVLIILGWLLDRKFSIHLPSLVKLNFYLFVPAFIFVNVIESSLSGAFGVRIVFYTCCIIFSMWGMSFLVSAMLREPKAQRTTLQLSTMFYNCGNFGVPLMALAYPEQGPLVQIFVLMTMNVTTFTIGLALANSHSADPTGGTWKKLMPILTMPPVYGIAAAGLIKFFDIPVQDVVFLWRPLKYLEGGLVAVALLTLGVQLSQTKHPPLHGKLAWGLAVRLIGAPLIGIMLTWIMGFEGITARVLILGAAAPTAINIALLALEYKADSAFAAAMVFYSTLISVISTTLLLVLLNSGLIPWTR